MISPYARRGFIDSQRLTSDAYLEFIEDDFLGGARLDPATDGRPDARPDVRENAPGLGNLIKEFDFNQTPRPPLILRPCPTNTTLPTVRAGQAHRRRRYSRLWRSQRQPSGDHGTAEDGRALVCR